MKIKTHVEEYDYDESENDDYIKIEIKTDYPSSTSLYFNKKELLILKSIPFYYLKGSIKQEIKKFFDKNIRLFLELLIFNMHGNNFKGIIYNKDNYNNTKLLNIEILEKNTILDYAVDIYYKQTFTKKTKSLDLGA